MMEAVSFSDTSVSFYETTRRNMLEESYSKTTWDGEKQENVICGAPACYKTVTRFVLTVKQQGWVFTVLGGFAIKRPTCQERELPSRYHCWEVCDCIGLMRTLSIRMWRVGRTARMERWARFGLRTGLMAGSCEDGNWRLCSVRPDHFLIIWATIRFCRRNPDDGERVIKQ
jgi:hypothetical protein